MSVDRNVWLVILNWNNARDTLECLASINDIADSAVAGIIVCDNASSDDSVVRLREWASLHAPGWIELGAPAGAGVDEAASAQFAAIAASRDPDRQAPLSLVHTGANLGYAGGNNVGLRLILEGARSTDRALVLNNDTVLTPGCITAMSARMEADPAVGICGATVVYAADGRRIQARGGAAFEPWLGRARRLGTFEYVDAQVDAAQVEQQLDYVLGAALMVSYRCLRAVGLMYEGYFLYFEEIDWCIRARRAGFRLAYAPQAVILHKEGGTIGSNHLVHSRSLLADYYLARSRLLFTRRFFPLALPTVFLYGLAHAFKNVLRRDVARAVVQIRANCGLSMGRPRSR